MRSWLPRLSRWKKNLVDVDGVGGVDSEKNGHGVEEGDDNDLHVVVRLEGEGGARDMAIMMIVIVGGVTYDYMMTRLKNMMTRISRWLQGLKEKEELSQLEQEAARAPVGSGWF